MRDGIDRGSSWCNGDSEWKNEQCKLPRSDPAAKNVLSNRFISIDTTLEDPILGLI